MVVASNKELDLKDLGRRADDPKFYKNRRRTEPEPYRPGDEKAIEVRSRNIVLTDDYAPVENLLAPVAETRERRRLTDPALARSGSSLTAGASDRRPTGGRSMTTRTRGETDHPLARRHEHGRGHQRDTWLYLAIGARPLLGRLPAMSSVRGNSACSRIPA